MRLLKNIRAGILLFFAGIAATTIQITPAQAASYTVSNTNDSGPGSLRQAIVNSDLSGVAAVNEIHFNLLRGAVIELQSSLPLFAHSVKIIGPGSSRLTVRRAPTATAKFGILSNGAPSCLISGMTIANAAGTPALRSFGSSTAGSAFTGTDLVFSNNASASFSAVGPPNSVYSLSGCRFASNSGPSVASNYSSTSLTLFNCGFSSNSSRCIDITAPSAYSFGNLTFSSNTATVISASGATVSPIAIAGCVFNNNRPSSGNGVVDLENGATMDVSNSTFSNNAVPLGNGGCFFVGPNSILRMANNTLDGNSATNGDNVYVNGGQFTFVNTIFSTSRSTESIHSNGGIVSSAGNNICSGDGDGFLNGPFDLVNTDARLQALGNNGGVVYTMALEAGSPAIEGGSDKALLSPFNLSSDARGSGYSRKAGNFVDIGAYEVQSPPPLPTLSIDDPTLTEGNSGSKAMHFTVKLSAASVFDVSFNYATVKLSASADSDYVAISSGQLKIPAGQLSGFIDVMINGDTNVENHETFALRLSNLSKATASKAEGIGTILDDDSSALIVNTLADTDDGACTASNCSLSEAVDAANSRPSADTIAFASNLSGVVTLLRRGLVLSGDTTIVGPGANVLKISGNDAFRVFKIGTGSSAVISGLTISNGKGAPATGPVSNGGGGIENDGNLILSDCALTLNKADYGSALYCYLGKTQLKNCVVSDCASNVGTLYTYGGTTVYGANVTLDGCSFLRNTAVYSGGAINNDNKNTLSITNSSFFSNSSPLGGAIINAGYLSVRASTFANNVASSGGGALYNYEIPYPGQATISNTTFSGNSSASGGAIFNSNSANLSVESSTFTGNSASTAGSSIYGYTNGIIAVRNSLFNTGSTTPSLFKANGSSFTSTGYNLSSDSASGLLSGPGDQVGLDPKISTLANNGGPTQTIALLPGSPALDAGDPAYVTNAMDFDQRGNGFPRVASGRIDIGALEKQSFDYDSQPPMVSISSPQQNQSVLPTFGAFTGSASDDMSVIQVQIKLSRTRNAVKFFWNGDSFGTAEVALPVNLANPNAPNTTWSYPLSAALKAAFDGGLYELTALSRDALGRQSPSVARIFNIDNAAPAVTISTPTQNQSVPISTFSNVVGSATDDIGITQVIVKFVRVVNGSYVYWNGNEFTSNMVSLNATLSSPNAKSTNWSFGISPALKAAMVSGVYKLFVFGRDGAGNFGEAAPRTFTIDADKPVVSVSIPGQNDILTFSSFKGITGVATDNVGVTQLVIKLVNVRSGVYYYWNGNSFSTTPASLPTSLSAPGAPNVSWSYVVSPELRAALVAGRYQIFASGRDGIGNFGESGARTFSISDGSANLKSSPSS